MQKFKIPKDPTDVDYYQAKIDPVWLGEQVISAATVSVLPASDLTISDITYNNGVVKFLVAGGVEGIHLIEITVTSVGRIRQRSIGITVKEG